MIVEGSGDAEFAENFGAEVLRRLIDGAAHQHMVACVDEREDGVGDRRRAAGIEHAARAALQLGHRVLQREVGEGAAAAIEELAGGASRRGALFIGDAIEHQRRGALNHAVDRALRVTFAAPRAD